MPIWSEVNGVGGSWKRRDCDFDEEAVTAMAAGEDFVVLVLLVAVSVTAEAVPTTAGVV